MSDYMTDGHDRMIAHLFNMPNRIAVKLPNGPNTPLPRYLVQIVGGAQRPMGGISGRTQGDPEINVRVEVDAAGGADAAVQCQQYIKDLVNHFKPTRQPTKLGGGVTIINVPRVRPPLPVSGGVYSVPVVIIARMYF